VTLHGAGGVDYLRRRHGKLMGGKEMKADCGGGSSANRMRAAVVALLWLATVHTAARADFVSYSFTGKDSLTGSPVTGSFSYNTSAPSRLEPASGTPQFALYDNAQGSLSITDNGHTYASTSVSADLSPNRLTLFSNPTNTAGSTSVDLSWTGPGLSSIASLPATITIDVNHLWISLFPQFSIGGGPSAPALGTGPITSLVLQTSPSTAPEPGTLTLAVIAATGALAAGRRGRRGL
jgi:hypothetical protein